jgi:hypothetical protein
MSMMDLNLGVNIAEAPAAQAAALLARSLPQ